MRGMLAGCGRAVMTTDAVAGYAGVVKIGRYPGIGCMAGFTIVATLNMQCMFTGRNGTVVAT